MPDDGGALAVGGIGGRRRGEARTPEERIQVMRDEEARSLDNGVSARRALGRLGRSTAKLLSASGTKYERAAVAATALMLLAGAAIFFYAPTDWLQGPVQRIFYLHVSSAIAAYGCFAVVLVGGIIYLRNESDVADRFARAGALVGVVFTTVTLVMGMLWAKKVWGAFWVWDARLTSTLVLWIIYAGYLLVRRLADPGRQAARIAAVVGIFGFVDVPVVHFSVTWWVTQHPGPVIINEALPPQMLATFLFTMFCTLVLAAVMIGVRYRIETLMDEQEIKIQEPATISRSREPELVP